MTTKLSITEADIISPEEMEENLIANKLACEELFKNLQPVRLDEEEAEKTTKPPSTPTTAFNCVPDPIPPERWTLTVEAVGAGPPLVVRVRKLLKAAWRCYGLRCTTVTEIAATPPKPRFAVAVSLPTSHKAHYV